MEEEKKNEPKKSPGRFQTFKKFIRPYNSQKIAVPIILLILIFAWIVFILLVKPLPISPTPSLVMVWASVLVLLIGFFPNILDKIKKIKVKDFELEFQETVTKASLKYYVSVSDLTEPIFSTKENFRNLSIIMRLALRNQNKPVLLVVNLKNDQYISIKMLQIYLFFLDLIGSSVFVLFISAKRKIQSISDIEKDNLLGAVSGKKILQVFFERFPELSKILNFAVIYPTDHPTMPFEEIFRSGRFSEPDLTNFFYNVFNSLAEVNQVLPQYLTKRDVKEWFRGQISNHTIESSITVSDLKIVRKALMEENEFIIICEHEKLVSLSSLCFLTMDISKKVIGETI